jgi:hypothetical protein
MIPEYEVYVKEEGRLRCRQRFQRLVTCKRWARDNPEKEVYVRCHLLDVPEWERWFKVESSQLLNDTLCALGKREIAKLKKGIDQ